MKTKISALMLGALIIFAVTGCGSDTPPATAEQKKNFGGGPPPADYMNAANAATNAAKKSQPDSKP